MYDINLICTMHREIGKCNSKELYDIIERANPEIIFEEFDISRTDNEYYKNGHYKTQDICSVETAAIMKYLENHQVAHIPVDIYDVIDFPEDLYTKISNSNEEYSKLVMMNFTLSCQQGFPYLNSSECSDLIERIQLIEKEVVKISDDKTLIDSYNLWQLETDNRENEMIKNIYDYSKRHSYNNAIFIIGTEHKKSIIKKILEYEKDSLKLNWKYTI